jgi:hypothetical protein
MVLGGQSHAPAALPPGKTWYPLYRRLGGPHNLSDRVGFDPWTAQPVASRYTDWAIPAHDIQVCIMNFKWFLTMHWWFIMRNTTNKCTYKYLNLLYYSLLHVSATYCGHLQGDGPFKIYYTERQNICNLNYIDFLCNISFKEHLPEVGHKRWPKHVRGCVDYDTINLYISIWTCRSYVFQIDIKFVSLDLYEFYKL